MLKDKMHRCSGTMMHLYWTAGQARTGPGQEGPRAGLHRREEGLEPLGSFSVVVRERVGEAHGPRLTRSLAVGNVVRAFFTLCRNRSDPRGIVGAHA